MNVCEDHDSAVVVFQGRHCPLCSVGKELELCEDEVENLKESVGELEGQLNELQAKVDDLGRGD